MKTLCLVLAASFLFCSCSLVRTAQENKRFNDITLRSPATAPALVPFDLRKGKLVVHAAIIVNGKKYPGLFAMDSGAPTILSQHFAARTGIPMEDADQLISTPTEGDINKPMVKKLSNVDLAIESQMIHYKAVRVMPILKNNAACEPLDGIIGADMMSHFNIAVDFSGKTLTLFQRSEKLPDNMVSQPLATIPFKTTNIGSPKIKAALGGISGEFIWDLGYNGSFIYQFWDDEDAAFKNSIHDTSGLDVAIMSGTISSGLGRDTQTSDYYRKKVQAASFGGKEVRFPEKMLNIRTNPKLFDDHGNIGTAFMADYLSFINWETNTIYLWPARKSGDKAVLTTIYATRIAGQAYVISLLSMHSAWAVKGLKLKDELLSIDGRSVNDILRGADQCSMDSTINDLLRSARTIRVNRGLEQTQVSLL